MSLIERIYEDVRNTFYKDPLVMVMDNTWIKYPEGTCLPVHISHYQP